MCYIVGISMGRAAEQLQHVFASRLCTRVYMRMIFPQPIIAIQDT